MVVDQPDRIDRYRILSRLGEGGMGIVYAAEDERLGRRVAIKVIRDNSADARTRERFWREARAAASINHPLICHVHEVGEFEGQPFLVMELLEGESLAHRLAVQPLPAPDAIRILLSVLDALDAMHRRGVVHRDLKPSNIFLTPHGVKLLDFGLARTIDAPLNQTSAGLTLPGVLVGTPHYVAPEQLNGGPIDGRADQFAAGAVLYEMLAGRPAFGGDTVVKVLHAVLYERPPALVGSGATAALDRIIDRATAKAAGDRYASAAEMANDLRGVLATADSGDIAPARSMTRLAVLPFRALRPDPDTDFLTMSLADSIAGSLTGMESVTVRSSLSTARFAGSAPDLTSIARELSVDVVLTGTLLRSGDQLRVNAQLINAPGGDVLWTQTSQVALDDVFKLHDELVHRIVRALPLSSGDRVRPMERPPANGRAYELYLRATNLHLEPSTWRRALDLYRQCVEADPDYAPAWAQIGRLNRVLAKYADAREAGPLLTEAEAAFEKAFGLDPDLGITHYYWAQLEIDRGEAEQAMVRLLKRAEKHRTEPQTFAGLVHAFRYCGLLDESIAAHRIARRLDPTIATGILHTYWMRGDYERVIEEGYNTSDTIDSLAYERLGRIDEAIAAARKEEERFASHQVMQQFSAGVRLILEGQFEQAIQAFDKIQAARFTDREGWYYATRGYARAGYHDRALSMLEDIVEGGFFCPRPFQTDPWLDPLRGRRQFVSILARVEARHQAAVERYLEARGPEILGLRVSR